MSISYLQIHRKLHLFTSLSFMGKQSMGSLHQDDSAASHPKPLPIYDLEEEIK